MIDHFTSEVIAQAYALDDQARAASAPEPVPVQRSALPEQESQPDAWVEWIDLRIAEAIEQHQQFLIEVVGRALAEERSRMRDHVAEQIGALRADVEVKEKAGVIDLAWPRRRSNAA